MNVLSIETINYLSLYYLFKQPALYALLSTVQHIMKLFSCNKFEGFYLK